MAHESEDHAKYLTDHDTVDKLYGLLQEDDLNAATEYLKGLGEDKIVVNTWIGVQCDINNVKGDALLSSQIGWAGVDYCMMKDYRQPAAIMLHNIGAFFAPNFGNNPSPEEAAIMVKAGEKQVPLRREIGEDGPLMWALWDLGTALLAAGEIEAAVKSLQEGAALAQKMEDRDGEAWCNVMIGKAWYLHDPDNKAKGETIIREAVKVIAEIGADWEKEGMQDIMKSVALDK